MNGMSKLITTFILLVSWLSAWCESTPVDMVNPYMGNISHLLMPTFPTVHVPYGMLRIYPQRSSYVDNYVNGLPVVVVNHRENCCFNFSATHNPNGKLEAVMRSDFDNEVITPYYYKTDIDKQRIEAEFTPSEHAAIYRIHFLHDTQGYMLLNSGNGEMTVEQNRISGYQNTWGGVKVYLYAETDVVPNATGILRDHSLDATSATSRGNNACVVLKFPGKSTVILRYAISFISVEQAHNNFLEEVSAQSFDQVMTQARDRWNHELGKITVSGGRADDLKVFYTSLYRCMERPVCISEQGRYFCPADHQIHSDEGRPFYTDDWLWDTYRATHPLRTLIDPEREADIIHSLVRTAQHDPRHWFPTFPAVTGDSRRMNCNHGVAVVADAWIKGINGFDLNLAYEYTKRAIEEKTLAPWSSHDASWLDIFYHDQGYIPALKPDEKETVKGVNGFEKRQAVAVTLGTSYDQWCLSQIASALGRKDEAEYYLRCSYNYRNLFNEQTGFFHPKDKDGNWIEPFDYRFSGGLGARDYYDENNGWTYRWDVQHNPADLIALMGGREKFVNNLDQTFDEWLGRNKYEFYSQLPDQTGNVGQFSMANEPSLHIPYLYNYAGQPWKTQKRIHSLINQWFRNDLMGVPGDEDGGGLSGFVVFSMMGLYPVTPGLPIYNLSSPFFDSITIKLSNGKKWHINALRTDIEAKYIQNATVNGQSWNQPWIEHALMLEGGTIQFDLGNKHSLWGSEAKSSPPSAMPMP